MKVGIYTLGCKVNTYESEYIASLFKEEGFILSDFDDDCDVYVINTCTVTNMSDKKDKKIINHVKHNHPDACIVVCGCFVESSKDYNFDGVDIVVGNYNKSKIVSFVLEYFKEKKQIVSKENIMRVPFEDMNIKHFEGRTRAFVKIQDGCENYCSYCIIPFVRGRCRSKKFLDVINEVKTLVDNGYKEIVLTGIHTGNYGSDIGVSFSSLLEELLNIEKLERLRISSIEITELDDKFFELLKNEKLCNHLHIPLQNGSDRILKLMNRKYNKQEFLNIINRIREVRSDISITTDVIVGFPGETLDDFKENLEFIKKVNFSKIHTFPYSKRNGTKAARMDNHLSNDVKKIRVREQLKLSDELEDKYFNSFIGKHEKVLIEKIENGYSYGHTSNYLYLKINEVLEENKIYDVVIKEEHKVN